MKDYFILAIKNLKHRGVRSWLTLLGIFIGILAVVSLISLGGALKMAVNSQFGISTTEVITVQASGMTNFGPPGSGAVKDLVQGDVDAISKLPSVDFAIGRILSTNLVEFNGISKIQSSVSIPDGKGRTFAYDAFDLKTYSGRFIDDGDNNKVMIGWNLHDSKDKFGKQINAGDKIHIGNKSFIVVGILKKQGSFIIDNMIYMNEGPLRDLSGNDKSVNVIVVKVKDKSLMDRAKEEIEKLMRQRRDVKIGEEDFEVSTPEAALGKVNSILNGVQAFIVIIASISILVGILGIVNTMTTSVMERKKEIGIMKAVGAKNSQIFLQFFIEAGMLGLVGGIAGAAIGSLIGLIGVYAINSWIGSEVSMNVDFYLIGFTLLGSFLVGAIAGIAPAMRAAKQNPVEALRG